MWNESLFRSLFYRRGSTATAGCPAEGNTVDSLSAKTASSFCSTAEHNCPWAVRGGRFFFNRVGRRCSVQRNGCIFTSHQGKMHIERNSKRLTRRCTPFLPSVQKCGPIVCVG